MPEQAATDVGEAEHLDLVKFASTVTDSHLKSYPELRREVLHGEKFRAFKHTLESSHDSKKLNLIVLGTGGTFQSAKTEHGLAPNGSLEESFEAMKLPYNLGEVSLNLFEIFNYDSSLLQTGEHIRFIAQVIIDLLKDCSQWLDGFIVTHGTDTMVETTNYLSLILGRGLKKPIILTGSQDPARVRHSDAFYNMADCLKVHELLKEKNVAEVMVLCGDELIRGAWAEKISDRDSNAFGSFNGRPLLSLKNRLYKTWKLADFALKANSRTPFLPFNKVLSSADIPVLKLADISTEGLARIVVASRVSVWTLLGSATCPNTHAEILNAAAQRGKPIVLRSPFHDAILTAGTYEAGSALAKSSIPQIKGTESFIRAKLNWLWHNLGLRTHEEEGLGEVLTLEDQSRLYSALCQDFVGEWHESSVSA